MPKKIFIYIFSILLVFLAIMTIMVTIGAIVISNDFFGIKDVLKKSVYGKYPNLETQYRKHLFKKNSKIRNLNNDYNVRFLPVTQFVDLDLTRKKIIFNDFFREKHDNSDLIQSFYIDEFIDQIILVDYLGGVYKFNKILLLDNNKKIITPTNISSNLSPHKVLDIKIYKEKLYVSFITKKNTCQNFNISVASLKADVLKFDDFFSSDTCEVQIHAGRMVSYQHKGRNGLLVSTSNQKSDVVDAKFHPSQEDSSIFGKILFFDLEKKNYTIFSKGHRNIQGLLVKDKLILSTEHGPKGGDEINKILFGKNYGWPIASYGKKYFSNNFYKNSHYSFGFEEPIFSYVPSIGISEIIKIPNQFYKNFEDNFLISSLNGKHVHRVKFSQNFDKVIFDEKIFIGSRIRDLKYDHSSNSILLALESNGEIGVLKRYEK
jgi:hypothetical protein